MTPTAFIRIKRLHPRAEVPRYQTAGAACCDLVAAIDEPVRIYGGTHLRISTGIAIEVPAGYEAQVRPRSGLALHKRLTLLNSPGVIDSDYRGPVGVVLLNTGGVTRIIQPGERIAQLAICPVVRATFIEVDELSETERGSGGFGSTGTGGA